MSAPIVSIVVPCFNCARFVSETVQSVLSQDYQDWELLLVDDRSTDDSLSILQKFASQDPRIRVIALEKNSGGPATPRNRGVAMAKGQYVAFLDSDDIWPRNKLSYQLKQMADLDLDFSSGDKRPFLRVPPLSEIPSDQGQWTKLSLSAMLRKNRVNTSSVVVKTSVLRGKTFDHDPAMVAVEDYKLWIELHQDQRLKSAATSQAFFNYRISDSGISRRKYQMAKKVYRVLKDVRIEGRGIGPKIYFYMLTYVWQSVLYSLRSLRVTSIV